MKFLISTLVFFGAYAAQAAQSAPVVQEVAKCIVPNSVPAVEMTITQEADEAVDFLLITLKDGEEQIEFFSQNDAGSVADQIADGELAVLVMSDSSRYDNGIIRNAGILTLEALEESKTDFVGFGFILGNIYPFACKVATVSE